MRVMLFGIVTVGTLGCRKPLPPPVASDDPFAALRAPVLDPLRARFSFKIDAPRLGLEGGTGGALIVDRPGRMHFAVLGPLGGAMATAQTDGAGASVVLRRQSQHFWVDSLDATVRGWMGEELGLDGVVGLFVGQVPLPDDPSTLRAADDGSHSYVRSQPGQGTMMVRLAGEPLHPSEVRIDDANGQERLTLRYGEFRSTDAGRLPKEWSLSVPSMELTLDVRFKSWEPLETAPEVFSTAAPEGFASAEWTGRLAPR
ncbi:MAG: DUF4292 domain-containing protein [Myxococcota bacterium]